MTWSNLFTGQPLTSENVAKAMAKLRESINHPIACTPSVAVMPRSVLLEWRWMQVLDARRALERAERRIRKGILSGHYQKRQRQQKHGVAQYRIEQRRRAIIWLPKLKNDLEQAQAAYDDENKPLPAPVTNHEAFPLFQVEKE